MSKRILFVVNGHAYTAAHRLALLEGAKAAGFDVSCAAPANSDAQAVLRRAGWPCHTVPLSRKGARIWTEARSIAALVRLYSRLRPDIVHHATIKPVIYGGMAARLARVPAVVNAITGLGYVFTSEDAKASILRRVVAPLYRIALRHPNHRVVFQNRDDMEVLGGLAREKDIVLIPGSGVDVEEFRPSPEPYDEPLVVLPARLLGDKGVREFVAAARRLRAEGVQARFALVGARDPGNPSAIGQDELAGWLDEGVVEWWGPRDDMAEVYRAASLVVLPSYREGMPKVLLEAAASGRAVVSTDVPGCRDAVRDGQTGYLVPPRDPEALGARLRELLADRDKRVRMGAAGRELVVERFATDHIVRATIRVYEELAQQA